MNLTMVRNEIKSHLGDDVEIQINGLRNKKTMLKGAIAMAYPNLFVIRTEDAEKSFSYADIITGEVLVKYL